MKWEYMDPERREPILQGASFDFRKITDSFYDWCSFPARSLLLNRLTGELLPVLDARRGNSKFAWKNRQQLEVVSDAIERNVQIDNVQEGARMGASSGLFITCNFPPSKMSLSESWLIKSEALRLFKAAMASVFRKKKLDDHFVSYHVAEAHKSGYCHIHCFVLLDSMLPVHLKRSRRKGELQAAEYWRLDDYNLVLDLKRAWARSVYHALCKLRELPYSKKDPVAASFAFNDIQAVVGGNVVGDEDRRTSGVISYLLKYMAKAPKLRDKKALLTLALQKLFGVRSIFSKRFLIRIGLGFNYFRHDSLKNELQQLKQQYMIEKQKQGSLSYPGSPADRIISYALGIKSGTIPPDAVFRRRSENLPFSWYSVFGPEIVHMDKPKPVWEFMFHARYYSPEEAMHSDEVFRSYRCSFGSIQFNPRGAHRKKILVRGNDFWDCMKTIVCSEGIDEYSPDFFSFLQC